MESKSPLLIIPVAVFIAVFAQLALVMLSMLSGLVVDLFFPFVGQIIHKLFPAIADYPLWAISAALAWIGGFFKSVHVGGAK